MITVNFTSHPQTGNSDRGFTLIEVVIAIMILSFVSLFTVQSIQKALQTKVKVQKDIDKNASLHDALRIMERDINLAFNHRDVGIKVYNLSLEARKKLKTKGTGAGSGTTGGTGVSGGSAPTGTTPPTDDSTPAGDEKFKPKVEKIQTQFIGEPETINFTTLSNVRISDDSKISTQAEVGYKLKSCRRRTDQQVSSNCLWRRVSNYIHDDITKSGEETVLLENVTAFKLRYIGPGREEEWIDTWITNERGDDQTKNKFPYAVEITLSVQNTDPKAKDKILTMTTIAAIRNPNNEEAPVDGKEGDTATPAR